ncbi:SLIT and NTRK-like protein 3 [Pollicipes pollicipes]|uniref:SLIT and NTRK-like protein 3 n=1 Tax=Pollicipes pollicipes TaxID=41117 RepID=UPI001884D737|nr:SLIT and NTRK-like protein 3 [Pollicipes pollicipes]
MRLGLAVSPLTPGVRTQEWSTMKGLVILVLCLMIDGGLGGFSKARTSKSYLKNHLLTSKGEGRGTNSITHASHSSIPLPGNDEEDVDDDDDYIDDDIYKVDSTGCPVPFGGRCRCAMAMYQKAEKYVVNCTNTGFTNVSVLNALPDNTEVLIFTGNFLDILPPNLFGTEWNFEDMETIDMSNNGIKEIDGQAFHRVSFVKTLILNHNSLYIVDSKHHPRVFSNLISLESLHLTNAFTENVDSDWYMSSLEIIFKTSMLTRLKKLHLEQNELRGVRDPKIFCTLPSLEHLYLGSNRLTDIDLDLLCLQRLAYVDLEYNSILRLDSNATALLDKLTARNANFAVKLVGNPFFCDCKIKPFYRWLLMTETRALYHESYRCFDGKPASNRDVPVMQLKHMECDRASPAPVARTSSASLVLGVLVFAMCVLLSVVIYMQRHRLVRRAKSIQPQLQTAIQNVKRARQYTNIERDEEAPEVSV